MRRHLLHNAALQERRDAQPLARKPVARLDRQTSPTVARAGGPEGRGPDAATRSTAERIENVRSAFRQERETRRSRWALARCREGVAAPARPCLRVRPALRRERRAGEARA